MTIVFIRDYVQLHPLRRARRETLTASLCCGAESAERALHDTAGFFGKTSIYTLARRFRCPPLVS